LCSIKDTSSLSVSTLNSHRDLHSLKKINPCCYVTRWLITVSTEAAILIYLVQVQSSSEPLKPFPKIHFSKRSLSSLGLPKDLSALWPWTITWCGMFPHVCCMSRPSHTLWINHQYYYMRSKNLELPVCFVSWFGLWLLVHAINLQTPRRRMVGWRMKEKLGRI
jgi:hypothetical protein